MRRAIAIRPLVLVGLALAALAAGCGNKASESGSAEYPSQDVT